MKGIGSLPPWMLVFMAVGFGIYLWKTRRRVSRRAESQLYDEQRRNVDTMRRIVNDHQDFTAEVINFAVFGERKARKSKLLAVGTRLNIKREGDKYVIWVHHEPLAELLMPDASLLPRVIEEKHPVDVYLGGRDTTNCNENFDACSLIAFYKLAGVPPTKVSLES